MRHAILTCSLAGPVCVLEQHSKPPSCEAVALQVAAEKAAKQAAAEQAAREAAEKQIREAEQARQRVSLPAPDLRAISIH